DHAYSTAASFRRQLQKMIVPHLVARPTAEPLAGLPRAIRGGDLPGAVVARWRSAPLSTDRDALARLPIDHGVAPVTYRGGTTAAAALVDELIEDKLARYADERNDPDAACESGL